jgi:hypothetical protein
MPAPKDPQKYQEWIEKQRLTHAGKKHTEKTKQRIAENSKGVNTWSKGRTLTEDHKQKVSESLKGIEFSEEHKKKLSDAAKKRVYTEEDRKRNSESHKGHKHSEVTIQKMKESRKGRKPSEYNIECVRRAHEGKKLTEETKQKISVALIGTKRTDETKKKMSEQRKGENHPLYGIPRSPDVREKISIKIRGERHSNWKGGRSKRRYCHKWREHLRERVREFFGRICINCYKTEMENGRRLCVHHVYHNKMACCDFSPRIFVPLCTGCHNLTNNKKNEEFYKEKFTKIVMEQYGGKSFYTKEEYEQILIFNNKEKIERRKRPIKNGICL